MSTCHRARRSSSLWATGEPRLRQFGTAVAVRWPGPGHYRRRLCARDAGARNIAITGRMTATPITSDGLAGRERLR
jgi:hypothetical protein